MASAPRDLYALPVPELTFEVPSSEGLPIRGRLAVAPRSRGRTVVCVHGFKGFGRWGFWPDAALRLVRAGFHAVRFDFSHSGLGQDGESFTETQLFESGTFTQEADDLKRVLTALSSSAAPGGGRVDPRRIGLLAHSRGSVAALAAAAAPKLGIRSVVLWNPIARLMRWDAEASERWRADGFWEVANARTGQLFRMGLDLLDDAEANGEALDPERNAARVEVPVLTLVGTEDTSVSPEEGRAIARSVPQPLSSLKEIPAGHTLGAAHPMTGVSPTLEAAFDATLRHFSATISEEGSA
jgi:pimeloyl-ACP methyl ester carboxylesterase